MENNTRKININMDSLKIPTSGGTRKKRDPVTNKFKIKTPPKPQTKSLKRNLLKFIRNQQAQKLKSASTPTEANTIAVDDFKSDFNESISYLSEVSKKSDDEAKVKNRTLKHYAPGENKPPVMLTNILGMEPIAMHIPNVMQMPSMHIPNIRSTVPPPPQYGCLKGGKLPLYRQFTRKNYDTTTGGGPIQVPPPNPTLPPNPTPQIDLSGGRDRKVEEIAKITNFMKSKYKPPPPKRQRKTIKRTYNVGKSKNVPRVSVLLSNKTIRNNISTKSQLLKQTPIQDVKKFLVKNGFIKIGSIAPNDVLRKMYETASLVCGEIHNYSPENLVCRIEFGKLIHVSFFDRNMYS
jgi:hypothetical protein